MSYQYKIEEYIKRKLDDCETLTPEDVGEFGQIADKEIEELENKISELTISVQTYGDKLNTAALVIGKITADNDFLNKRLNNE